MAQKISISRKKYISQALQSCPRELIWMKGMCQNPPGNCEEVSNKLIFLARWQIGNRIMHFKGREGPLCSFGYDILYNIVVNFPSRDFFFFKKKCSLKNANDRESSTFLMYYFESLTAK